MKLSTDETELAVKVTDFTVQYILKDLKYDMPQPQPTRHYSARIRVLVPSTIIPYIPTFIKNMSVTEDAVNGKDTCPFPYNLPKDVASAWKAWLKAEYPDFIIEEEPIPGMTRKKRRKMDADEIAAAVISCTLEDTLKDALEECWDTVLGPKYKNAIPVAPEGYKVACRYIHLLKWTPEL